MRIAIGQLWQESNTFNPLPTTRDNFEQFGVLRGDELLTRLFDTNELGGFIQSLRAWPERPEIVSLVRLGAWPSGVATEATFEWVRKEIVDALDRAGPLDAVLLALHGSMVADGHPDVEGDILEAVRQRIGRKIPLVATLDLHANVTAKMAAHADALVLYHTSPHIDVFETGQRGAAVLHHILRGAAPSMAIKKIPAVFPVERANTQDPASVSYGIREQLQTLEACPGVLSAGLATVQPWLDIEDLGSTVVVVTDNDPARAVRECVRLATDVWGHRNEYRSELTPLDVAVREAFELHKEGLIVISDSADATTSGAPGDSNWVLREALKYEWSRPVLIPLVAPDVVAEAQKLGIGGQRTGPLGGVLDHRFSRPLTLTTDVVGLFDACFTLSGHLANNLPIDMGPSAVLRHGAIHLVVTSRTGPHFAPQLFETAGLAPFEAALLVAKSPCGFRAAYEKRARRVLVAKTAGCAPAEFWHYEYRNISRPLWPWDEMEWSAEK